MRYGVGETSIKTWGSHQMWMIKPSSQDSGGCTCSLPPTIRKDVSYRYLTCRPNSAALHHPDKTASNDPSSSSEAYFVHLKLAQDTLLDPVKRFAYDRFGPDIIKWRHCSSIRDYVMVGLQTTAPYYAASGLFMVILGVVGYLEWGRYVHPPPYHLLCTNPAAANISHNSGATYPSSLSSRSSSIHSLAPPPPPFPSLTQSSKPSQSTGLTYRSNFSSSLEKQP